MHSAINIRQASGLSEPPRTKIIYLLVISGAKDFVFWFWDRVAVAQDGLELTTQLIMTLNVWSSCPTSWRLGLQTCTSTPGLFHAGDQPGASCMPHKHSTYWATPSALCWAFSLFYSVKKKPGLMCGRQTLYHWTLQNVSLKGKKIQIEVILDSQLQK